MLRHIYFKPLSFVFEFWGCCFLFFLLLSGNKQKRTALLLKHPRSYSGLQIFTKLFLGGFFFFCLAIFIEQPKAKEEENAKGARKARTHKDSKESKQNRRQAAGVGSV